MKHPETSPNLNTLLTGSVNEVLEIIFDDITKGLIQKASIRTKGAASPSKFYLDDW